MESITLRVINGPDRGKVLRDLSTPFTIGREEGNVVQLNDERVSRYHVKVQEDDGRLVVTDLESTNGTRVNGHPCNLKILRYGDTISIGRSVLLVGSREQVAEWFANDATSSGMAVDSDPSDREADPYEIDASTNLAPQNSPNFSSGHLALPRGLSAGQSAELRELLDHIHIGMRQVLENASVDEKENRVCIKQNAWQSLLMTQSEISELIRDIEDPPSSNLSSSDTGSDQ